MKDTSLITSLDSVLGYMRQGKEASAEILLSRIVKELKEKENMPIDYESAPNGFGGLWQRYFDYGVPPGDFGEAILTNNLIGAVGSADDVNSEIIHEHIMWLWNNAPGNSWGSEERFNAWVKKGGLRGERGEKS